MALLERPVIDAKFILAAIVRKYPTAAIVPEVTLHDHLWEERFDVSKPTRRIDALMFQTLERTAIEVKVSRADFARDDYAKRAPWQAVTHRFIYAVPESMADVVAFGCGVWAVDDYGNVRVVRKASTNKMPEPLPQQVIQVLAYRAAKQTEPAQQEADHD